MFAPEQSVSVADRRKAAAFASEVGSHAVKIEADAWATRCFKKAFSDNDDRFQSRSIPILSLIDSPLYSDTLGCYARDLLSLLRQHISEKFHNLNGLISESHGKDTIVTLVDLTLRGSGADLASFGNQRSVPIDLLAFFATYLARPFREKVSQLASAQSAFDNWPLGYCPVCGLWARMGRISADDGHLRIWCIGCDHAWRFPRLRCPFCQEREAANLGYLNIDGTDRFRAYTCESCRRYLKAITTSDSENVDYDAEYLSSSAVDLTAGFEGYIQDFVGYAAFDMKDNAASRTYRQKAMS